MRLLIAALVLSLVVAVTAASFAIWPVVGDAPWEQTNASADKCGTPQERRKVARELGVEVRDIDCSDVLRIRERNKVRCKAALDLREAAVGSTSTNRGMLQTANQEIDRYC